MRPLAEAWDFGAAAWNAERRKAYANDLGADRSLTAVTAKTTARRATKNRPSGCRRAPPPGHLPRRLGRGELRWNLTADTAEAAAFTRCAAACPTATATATYYRWFVEPVSRGQGFDWWPMR